MIWFAEQRKSAKSPHFGMASFSPIGGNFKAAAAEEGQRRPKKYALREK
jgi:hypothetical protein